MLEFLTQYVDWWHWVVIGILFIILEMATGSFITLGFGIAAIVVGLLHLITEINFLIQIVLWIVLSIVIILVLFKYFKNQPIVSSTGQSNHGFDTVGTVIKSIEAHGRGKVRFDTPVLGNSAWTASSEVNIKEGSRVTIEEVNGQLLKVTVVS